MSRLSHSFLVFCSIVSLLILVHSDIFAQRTSSRSRRTTREPEPTVSLADKLNYEIKLGNIGFGGNTFGLAVKGNVGYKFFDRMSAGLGLKTNFEYLNYPAGLQDESGFDFGAFGYLRGKITKTIYLQGEYGYQSFSTNTRVLNPVGDRITAFTPALGGGYMNGGEKWSYGAEILFNLNDRAQDFYGIIEYWINFSYKF